MKIAIFPYARALRNGANNPKNYPWWSELVELLIDRGHRIIQLGVEGEDGLVDDFRVGLNFNELCGVVKECDTWISVDSFGQHLGWSIGKRGVALFAQSDPLIFGHSENVNLLKDRKYLREKQFWMWEQCEPRDDAWITPMTVVDAVETNFTE